MNRISKILVTGGAGFIGSHIVDRLIDEGFTVRVLDNLSTGNESNLAIHFDNNSFDFIEGDIRNVEDIRCALDGVDAVFHEAALVSVTKSVQNPLLSNYVNVVGSLNLLKACVDFEVKRFVFASSCAVYGDNGKLPVSEESAVKPLSPYAVDKIAVENYARVFNEIGDLETVGLRYFNVYGPRQRSGPYSGVISLFVKCFLENKSPTIYGDGEQTRDFISVFDVVEANLAAMTKPNFSGEVFNVCTGSACTVNSIFKILQRITGNSSIEPFYSDGRVGDVRYSFGDNSKAREVLDFEAKVELEDGLEDLVDWFSKK